VFQVPQVSGQASSTPDLCILSVCQIGQKPRPRSAPGRSSRETCSLHKESASPPRGCTSGRAALAPSSVLAMAESQPQPEGSIAKFNDPPRRSIGADVSLSYMITYSKAEHR
jgi:hypothetical protein